MRFPEPLPVQRDGDRTFVAVDGVDVPVTNLEKVFWPDEGITKGDLLTYYFNIAPTILPHVYQRPLALKRLPNGIGGNSFFQRNAPAWTPNWVPLCAIEPADSKVDETVMIEKTADLLFVANLGAIELHPLHSRCERYDLPDYLVIDLDPMPPAGFEDALVIAQQVKVVLDHLGLRGYPKTSGATGLQIFVPVEPKHSYAETRALAEAMALAIARVAPELVTLQWDVTRRGGRVFIDHKMNRRAASLASAYSVRPEPGGTVSAPITWEEMRFDTVHPRLFTMDTIFDRLGLVGDLFRPVIEAPQDLDPALDAMGIAQERTDISEGRMRRRMTAGQRRRRSRRARR
jgi:bifunctional non-homologous end joining protein LigD